MSKMNEIIKDLFIGDIFIFYLVFLFVFALIISAILINKFSNLLELLAYVILVFGLIVSFISFSIEIGRKIRNGEFDFEI